MERKFLCSLGCATVARELDADPAGTLQKIAGLGYTSVEYYGEPVLPPEQVAGLLSENGLALSGWHIEWRHLQPDTIENTIAYCKKAGLRRVIIPCLGSRWEVGHTLKQECKEVWLNYLPRITAIYERLTDEGMELGYHNHEHEFLLHYDGQRVFDLLYENLPQGLVMELDTGNTIEAGISPADVIRKYHDRKIVLHCKPYSKEKGFDIPFGGTEDENRWPPVFEAFGEKTPELIVECETETLDPFQTAGEALPRLRKAFSDYYKL